MDTRCREPLASSTSTTQQVSSLSSDGRSSTERPALFMARISKVCSSASELHTSLLHPMKNSWSCWRSFMVFKSRCVLLAVTLLPFAIPFAESQTTFPAQFVTGTSVGSRANTNLYGTADFNGDGRPDILTISSASKLAVLLQNSDGTFTERDTAISPYSITQIADVNGDGKPDIITASGSPQSCGPPEDPCTDLGPATLNVYLGNGDGTFRSIAPVNMTYGGDGYITMLVTDLNGDGAADVAVTIGDNFYDTLQILLNDGTGVFHLQPSPNPAIPATLLTAGDFRGNGKVDLVVESVYSTMLIVNNAGDGNFTPGAQYTNVFANAAAVADFNRDGHLDLLVANVSNVKGPGASLILGTSGGLSTTLQPINAALVVNQGVVTYPSRVAVGDFNHDGYPDIAFSYNSLTASGNDFIGIFPNTGHASFANPRIYPTGEGQYTSGLEVADFNGDGNLDLLTEGGYSGPMIAFGDKAGNFIGPLNTISPASGSITKADFNGDGKADIAVVNEPFCSTCNSSVSVYPGSGKGYLGQGHTYSLGVPYAMIAAGDVNGDGKMDLVVTRAISPTQQYGTLPTLTNDVSV